MERCWSGNAFLTGYLMLWPLFAQATPESVVHRAVEPAQVLLDVSMQQNQLALYLTIPASALEWVAPNTVAKSLADQLQGSLWSWSMNEDAGCTLRNHRVFMQAAPTLDNGSAKNSIQSIYEFHCLDIDQLNQLEFDVQEGLPGLKQVNAWISTPDWQNKQLLTLPERVLYLKPEY